jgi:hypothetical protein
MRTLERPVGISDPHSFKGTTNQNFTGRVLLSASVISIEIEQCSGVNVEKLYTTLLHWQPVQGPFLTQVGALSF